MFSPAPAAGTISAPPVGALLPAMPVTFTAPSLGSYVFPFYCCSDGKSDTATTSKAKAVDDQQEFPVPEKVTNALEAPEAPKSEVLPEESLELEEIERQQTLWKLRPSVGTWLMPVRHAPCSADSDLLVIESITPPQVASTAE